MPGLQSLFQIVIYLIVTGLIVWLLLWLIDYIGLGEPFNRVAKVIVVVAGVLIVIYALMGLTGVPVR